MKTLLLDNDAWFWPGLEEFCKSFDPKFIRVGTEVKGYHSRMNDYVFIACLAQPTVERCIVASAFETQMSTQLAENGRDERDNYWQLEHFVSLIEGVVRFRDGVNPKPLTFEINYHGIHFADDVVQGRWGEDFARNLPRLIRQNPDLLVVNIYNEYKFVQRLTEKDFDKRIAAFEKKQKKETAKKKTKKK